MRKKNQKNQNLGILRPIAVGVTFLFVAQLLFQISSFFFLVPYKGGLINARFLLWQGIQTWPVIKAILFSVLIYFVLLTIISTVAQFASRLLVIKLKIKESIEKVTVLNLLLIYIALMVINVFRYPQTLVRLTLIGDWSRANYSIPYYIAVIFLIVILIACCAEVLIILRQKIKLSSRLNRRFTAVITMVFVSIVAFLYIQSSNFSTDYPDQRKPLPQPNIILIGLDSVRADIIEDEKLRGHYLPNLNTYLDIEKTAWFTNTFTPIARTFAAWYALLSGTEPKVSGVRYNLQQLTESQKESTVVPLLAKQGYFTIYGSDEKRFSVIDKSYGFQETFGPPPGAADWLLSFMEDNPIHNLLRDTTFSRILMPHTHANRAASTVYFPRYFVNEVERELSTYDHTQPLFLSLHLCLSHWPYTWAAGRKKGTDSAVQIYLDALTAVDQQFGNIMAVLSHSGVLENSIVIVFSDHGEGLVSQDMGANDPLLIQFNELVPSANDFSKGHGTDLLTVSQNKVLLSVRNYTKISYIEPGRHSELSSLLDIAPTLARVSGIENYHSDGVDLSAVAEGKAMGRLIFMETGFDLAALHRSELDISLLVEQGISTYEIAETGLMQVKGEYHDYIIKNKQFGVTDGQFLVANPVENSMPTDNQQNLVSIEIFSSQNEVVTNSVRDQRIERLKNELLNYYDDELLKTPQVGQPKTH